MDYNAEYERIESTLDEYMETPESPVFAETVNRLEGLAQMGHPGAIGTLAEIRAYLEAYRDADAAYFWYFIAHYRNGYLTTFNNEAGNPEYYCGPVGDFRNGEAVSDLVKALGFERVQQLDAKATEWLAERNIRPGYESGPWQPTPGATNEPISAYLSRP